MAAIGGFQDSSPYETYGSTLPRPHKPIGSFYNPSSSPFSASYTASTNPGEPGGYGGPASGGTPTTESTPTTPTAPAPRPKVTSLLEGDPGKLSDPAHIAVSPKYQFLSLAPYYGRGQENDLLHQLQTQFAPYWQGWTFDGHGNFVYGGDPSQLNPAWDGATFVDAYGGYGGGGPLAARWGVGENMAPQDPQAPPSPYTGAYPFEPQGYPGLPPGAVAAAPQQPSIFNDPSFWSSLMQLMGPASGGMASPSFGGAQYGGSQAANTAALTQNAQLQNLLSQLLASAGGR